MYLTICRVLYYNLYFAFYVKRELWVVSWYFAFYLTRGPCHDQWCIKHHRHKGTMTNTPTQNFSPTLVPIATTSERLMTSCTRTGRRSGVITITSSLPRPKRKGRPWRWMNPLKTCRICWAPLLPIYYSRYFVAINFLSATVKPRNKDRFWDQKHMVFDDSWSSFSDHSTWDMKGLSWPCVVFVGQWSLFPGVFVS